ncbi:hypothetical protein BD626DRAFT_546066 [Schizophyllum amplum]|uniref:DUF7587 domain-containing protein n=1 Tax=Schizophyllum amplum TaxID=97359 RepID=A0A550CQM2_9AGAR|nr:hypothetical protein BD626DRAFT_546066 [Auriculariopsis ampla]
MGYEDVARHLTWTTRTESPLISANFSFSWSVWDALRRYHASMKKDIQIAVIDAHQVAHKAATAMELMQKDAPSKKDKEYWKWRRYALESQLVFVHGSIPGSAVYATIPLLAIVEKLPTYFLLNELDSARPADVAWDYKDKRSSYHAFCQLMSDRFMKLPSETRVRDTTAGAVRLAVAFLRPWFHSVVAEDFGRAVTTACELAFAIAHWPGRWWARGHDEVWTLIRALVHLLAEELREAHHVRVTKEVEKLEAAIHDLEAQLARRRRRSVFRA